MAVGLMYLAESVMLAASACFYGAVTVAGVVYLLFVSLMAADSGCSPGTPMLFDYLVLVCSVGTR
jgi:threonine/homoserine/homoserine lactone efflux protein